MNANRENSIFRHLASNGVKSLPSVKNIIAVASGKGGVGKSMVALNLALALQHLGLKAGLLDADIYGPSQAHMLNVTKKPFINEDKSMEPIIVHGLQTMSIAYLLDAATPAIWRGPMVSGALQQMLTGTKWCDLDVLIIDLPSGTGDIQLTLAQNTPVCGVVIVTTPQDIALLDVNKAINMFKRVKTPIFGVIENMSVHTCTNCGHQEHIFGSSGAAKLSAQQELAFLGSIPLDQKICKAADAGQALMLPEFLVIAVHMLAELAKVPRNLSLPMENIVIEDA